ncbi:uncharacterized protein LOC122050887 [Zingiber officinale]|uniref:uncharacterized protein LOC122050887 n=1 Tax=Zingiber officinale TaxID=94328 RepID=UPI001C4D8283|nr:uncharacterized protein LOC122050887 [Zingiber officinale]
MDNNIEGSSNLSSSSSDDDNYAESFGARQQLIAQVISTNNQIILNYLNEGNNKSMHRGSIPGQKIINCNREAADRNLFNDYFAENALYNDAMFRRRFRMGRNLFMCICDVVTNHDNYFIQRRDGLGRLGLSSLQKITAVFRILAYGVPADATDEYIKIGESIAIESMKRFCRAVVEVFGEQYLRSPNAHDVARLLHIGELWGFPGITISARYDIQGKEYNMCYYLADDERDLNALIVEHFEMPTPDVEPAVDDDTQFEEFLAQYRQIKDKEAHIALRNTLIEHL